MYSATKDQTW